MTASHNPGHGTKGDIKAWLVNIAKVSYPGRSTETTDFAILAVVDPIWMVTRPSGMEIFGSQGHVSLRWTPSGSPIEWRISAVPRILAHFEQPK